MKTTISALGALSAILLIVPSFSFAAEISTSALVDGNSAIVTVQSDTAMPDSIIDLELYDVGGNKISQAFVTADISSGLTSCDWSMSAPAGSYTLKIGVFSSDWSTLNHWNDHATLVTGLLAGNNVIECAGSDIPPTFSSSASTPSGAAGDMALFTTTVHAGQNMPQVLIDTEVYDLAGNKVAQWWEVQDLFANTPMQITYQSTLPSAGMYRLKVGLFTSDWSSLYQWNDGAGGFTTAANNDISLIFATDPSSPSYTIAAGTQSQVTMGVYRLHAFNEAISLEKVSLKLSSGSTGSLGQIYLYDGLTLVGTAVFTSGSTTTTSVLMSPMYLQKDTDRTLTIKADLAHIGTAQPGKEGDLIVIDPLSAEGTGQSSGVTMQALGTGSVAGVRIFRGYPTIALEDLPSTGNTDGRLMRFKITASPFNTLNLHKFTFTVSTTSETLSNFQLFAFSNDQYTWPSCCLGSTGQVGSTITATDGTLVFSIEPWRNPLEVPTGWARYFELRGAISDEGPGAGHSITLKGDTTFDGMKAAADVSGNFIWSPNSTTTSPTSTNDWTNGYGISGLPADGIVQHRVY